MAASGYGKGYRYAHDFENAVVEQTHLPEALKGKRLYHPTGRGYEAVIKKRLDTWRRWMEERKKADKEGG
jgi:putative ATPase